MSIIVVGAGLVGLACAKVLIEHGAEALVFEASDEVGGRVQTDEKDGFLLDRGFQVYFTAYPVARRHLDHENRMSTPGLVFAGEYTEDSSINGSMLSGEKAAEGVMHA